MKIIDDAYNVTYQLISDVPDILRRIMLTSNSQTLSILRKIALQYPIRHTKHLSEVINTLLNKEKREGEAERDQARIALAKKALQCTYSYSKGETPSIEKAAALSKLVFKLILNEYDKEGIVLSLVTNTTSEIFLERLPAMLQILPESREFVQYQITFHINKQVCTWIKEKILCKEEAFSALRERYDASRANNVSPECHQLFAQALIHLLTDETLTDETRPKIYDVTQEHRVEIEFKDILPINLKPQNIALAMIDHLKSHETKPDDSQIAINSKQKNSLLCCLIPYWIASKMSDEYLHSLFPGIPDDEIPYELYHILRQKNKQSTVNSDLDNRISIMLRGKTNVTAATIRQKAAELPLFRYLLQDGIVNKRQDLIIELLRCSVHYSSDGSVLLTPPLSAYRRMVQQKIDHIMATGQMYYSYNSLVVVLGTIISFMGTVKVIELHRKNEFRKCLYDEYTRTIDTPKLYAVLKDAYNNFDLVWNDIKSSNELSEFLFQKVSNNDNELKFFTKYLRLYWDATYTALKLNLRVADVNTCADRLICRIKHETDRFLPSDVPLDHFKELLPDKGAYDTILSYLFYGVEELDERVREDVIMELCTRSTESSPLYRPIANSILAYLTYALIEDKNVNITKDHYKELLQKLFGDRNYWFMDEVFNALILQSDNRREFFVQSILSGLEISKVETEITNTNISTSKPPFFMMYASPLKDSLVAKATSKNKDSILFLIEADTLRRKSYGKEDLSKNEAVTILKSLFEMGGVFIDNCWRRLADKKDVQQIEILDNVSGYVYGMNLLAYSASNILRYHPAPITDEFLSAAIFSDYLTRKIHPFYPVMSLKENVICLYCGALRLTCQMHNARNSSVQLPEQMEMDYLKWIEQESGRYKLLLFRLLAYTSLYNKKREELKALCEPLLKKNISFLAYDNITPFSSDAKSQILNVRFLKNPKDLQESHYV